MSNRKTLYEKSLEFARERDAERAQWQQRRQDTYGIPENAIDEYLRLEDSIGVNQAKAIFDFIEAIQNAHKETHS